MLYYQVHIDEALEELQSSRVGLTKKQSADRLKKYGPNSVRVSGEPLWRKIVEPFISVFMAVLGVAAVISLAKGEHLDAIIVIAIIAISAIIYWVQRFSTERILRALQKKEQQKVEVVRGGETLEVWSEELVPGDIMLLGEGQKVPADARLIHGANVRCDESLLTGESVPVSKQTHPIEGKKQVYERTNMLFQGSFVVSGEAKALVVRTGNRTEFGQLAVLSRPTEVQSPVQKKIDKLISQIIVAVGAVAALAFGLALYRGIEFAEALRFVLALAVSAVPEGLPVAITIVLVLGMHRMAKKKALVRNMRAIESVGVITTIATDKTGTLTKNKLTVQKVWWPEDTGSASAVAGTSLLAANSSGDSKTHDPLDTAMVDFAKQRKVKVPKALAKTGTIPFEHRFAMSGNVWKRSKQYDLFIKGAPEQVLARSKLKKAQSESAHHHLHSLTGEGFRVIALASATLKKPISSFDDLPKKDSLEFIGFLAVADELRPEARPAVHAAQRAGVTVRMITGDHFETAFSIGKQLDMAMHRDQVFDSRTTDTLSKKQFSEAVEKSRVFSRVIPEHKHRILSVLKEKDITAMTGDGVNDVPALANAHVGVAMGSGSQIAKEAGDIVLLDNNFRSIIAAMREGRIIFSNIRRMLFYVLATNAGEVLAMLGALIIGVPLPLVAVQILWINLVTDTTLMIPLGLEPGEKNVMKTKPREPRAPILGKLILSRMMLVALSMAAVTLGTFIFFLQTYSVEYARTLAFSVLVVMQWANAFNARSELDSILTRLRVHNTKFYIGLAIAVFMQVLAMFGPLQEALHVVPVALDHLAVTGLIAIVVPIMVGESHKYISRKIRAKQALANGTNAQDQLTI